jgi:hypothetical protein
MTSSSSMSGERTPISMLMDRIPRNFPCSHYVVRLRDRIVHVLEEVMVEAGHAGAIKGRDMRLEERRIRSRSSRDRHGMCRVVRFCDSA